MKKSVEANNQTLPSAIDIMPFLKKKKLQEHLSSAIAFQKKGMVVDAVREWKDAITIDKNDMDSHLSIALAYLDMGDTKKARRHFEIILKNRPLDFDILGYMGILCFETGDYRKAIKYFEKVLTMKPDDKEILLFVSEAFQALDMVQEAMQMADKALRLYPRDADVIIRKALLFDLYGDFHRAISILKESLTFNPFHGFTHYTLGTIYLEHDWLDFAINSLKKASTYLLEPSEAIVKLSAALYCRGESEEATKRLQDILAINPECSSASLLLINNYIVEEKLDEAEELLNGLIGRDRFKTSHTYAMLGIIYYKRGDVTGDLKKFRKSASFFKKALKLDPKSIALKINVARAMLYSGSSEAALLKVEDFIKQHPAQPQFYFLLGDIYQSLGLLKYAEDSRKFAELLGRTQDY